jgi:hypothetical protein
VADEQAGTIDFVMDRGNLYREETFTDLKTGAIRRLIPVKPDGSEDKTRKPLFMGQTSLMTSHGPLPIQSTIDAKDLQQAIKKFPEAMRGAMDRIMDEMKKAQEKEKRKEESRIIIPGR